MATSLTFDGVSFPDGSVQYKASRSPRAWVTFNGTSTVSILSHYNISSITDNGTGDYTINFTVFLPHVNYCAVAMAQRAATNDEVNTSIKQGVNPTTSSLRIACRTPSSGAAQDPSRVCVAMFSE